MPRHPRAQYRTHNGVTQRLCANPKCASRWQPLEAFAGKTRCHPCRNAYQRDYYHTKQAAPPAQTSRIGVALDELARVWPERMTKFEDKGTFNYETNKWEPTLFDYDSLPDSLPNQPDEGLN